MKKNHIYVYSSVSVFSVQLHLDMGRPPSCGFSNAFLLESLVGCTRAYLNAINCEEAPLLDDPTTLEGRVYNQ